MSSTLKLFFEFNLVVYLLLLLSFEVEKWFVVLAVFVTLCKAVELSLFNKLELFKLAMEELLRG